MNAKLSFILIFVLALLISGSLSPVQALLSSDDVTQYQLSNIDTFNGRYLDVVMRDFKNAYGADFSTAQVHWLNEKNELKSQVIGEDGAASLFRNIMAHAIALTGRFLAKGEAADKSKALEIVNFTIDRYTDPVTGKDASGKKGWVARTWCLQSCIVARDTAFVSWIFWDDITEDRRLKVQRMLGDVADFLVEQLDGSRQSYQQIMQNNNNDFNRVIELVNADKNIPEQPLGEFKQYGYQRDTGYDRANFTKQQGEDANNRYFPYAQISNYINQSGSPDLAEWAGFLLFAAGVLPQHPHVGRWIENAKCAAHHTVTNGAEAQYCGMRSKNMYNDYTISHHGFKPNFAYSSAILAGLQQGEIAYQFVGKPIPSEFGNLRGKIWDSLATTYNPDTFELIGPNKVAAHDWGDVNIKLMMQMISYEAHFGPADLRPRLTELESRITDYFRTHKSGVLRVSEVKPSRPLQFVKLDYGADLVNEQNDIDWFANGLSDGRGAGEIIIYHKFKNGQLKVPTQLSLGSLREIRIAPSEQELEVANAVQILSPATRNSDYRLPTGEGPKQIWVKYVYSNGKSLVRTQNIIYRTPETLPKGAVSLADCASISGWAMDFNSPSSAVKLDFWLDKVDANNKDLPKSLYLGQAAANQVRSEGHYGFNEDHGVNEGHLFTFNLSTITPDPNNPDTENNRQQLFSGKNRDIRVYALNLDSQGHGVSGNTHIGTTTLQCASPPSPSPYTVCAQVITSAKNPKTSECKDFGTPCDIPDGWEKVMSCNLTVCAQVITSAKNPKTSECKDFGTPCDIPDGWEKVMSCNLYIGYTISEDLSVRNSSTSPTTSVGGSQTIQYKLSAGASETRTLFSRFFYSNGKNVDTQQTIKYKPPPPPPTALTAPSISGSCPQPGTQATVSWSSVSGASSYDVRVDGPGISGVSNNCGPHAVCMNNFGATSLSFNTQPGASYNAWVHAFRDGTEGPQSNIATFNCLAAPAAETVVNDGGTIQTTGSWSEAVPHEVGTYGREDSFLVADKTFRFYYDGDAHIYAAEIKSQISGEWVSGPFEKGQDIHIGSGHYLQLVTDANTASKSWSNLHLVQVTR